MYEKQNFLPGQKLKAAQLNHMEEGIAAAVTIDLLWENHELASGSVNSMGECRIPIPTLSEYEMIEIHHITDDSTTVSNRFDLGVLDGFGGALTVNTDDWYTRHFWTETYNGVQTILFADHDISCVPVRIYGIKGVRSASALQTCRVDAERYDMISFERGMTWGEWCDSPYNAFEDRYYISDGELNNGAGSPILNPSGSRVSSSDYIGVGVVYHGV